MLINNFEGSVILRWSGWLFEESWDSQNPPKYLSPHHLGRCNSHTNIFLVIVWDGHFPQGTSCDSTKKTSPLRAPKIHLILQESLCILTKLDPKSWKKQHEKTLDPKSFLLRSALRRKLWDFLLRLFQDTLQDSTLLIKAEDLRKAVEADTWNVANCYIINYFFE